jgi:hypothetical protein
VSDFRSLYVQYNATIFFEAPDSWCSIQYYELDTQIGEQFKAPSRLSEIIVDGGMDPSGGEYTGQCKNVIPNHFIPYQPSLGVSVSALSQMFIEASHRRRRGSANATLHCLISLLLLQNAHWEGRKIENHRRWRSGSGGEAREARRRFYTLLMAGVMV